MSLDALRHCLALALQIRGHCAIDAVSQSEVGAMGQARKSLYILPSLFTVASIFCGFFAITLTMGATTALEMQRAALLIFLGMILDTFDGRVARMTHTQSAFGVQLDSLADVITFGVAPGVVLYHFALRDLGFLGLFAAFCFVACGALRLARFNVQAAEETGPSTHFLGLPIPAAAGVAMSFVWVLAAMNFSRAPEALALPAALMMMSLGLLMVSSVRYKTFKKVRVYRHEKVLLAFSLLMFATITVQWGAAFALAACLSLYLAIGLVGGAMGLGRRGMRSVQSLRGVKGDVAAETLEEEALELELSLGQPEEEGE